jgi:hypothetical protein
MERVRRDQALNKHEFHERLRNWFNTTDDFVIGPGEVIGPTPWVYVRQGSGIYQLHADTPREAVGHYLQEVGSHGDDLQWEIVESQRGKMTALVYGPQKIRLTSFYLYVA